jgi:hypothetical protein
MNAVESSMPVDTGDPINARILAVSEDRISGFSRDPLSLIAQQAGLERNVVVGRIAAMLRAGTIRRVRQTLLATNLAHGALVAWQVPEDRLHEAFDFLFQRDPFSGHVVIRSADLTSSGSRYRLWTTLKVPAGYSLERHCDRLGGIIGALSYRIMPARRLFVLGVGHVRRRAIEVGSMSSELADVIDTQLVHLDPEQWAVLLAMKREFSPEELESDELWLPRADEAQVSLDRFIEVAQSLNRLGVIGRFSTFLEHVKPLATGERVTRFNGLFHWAVEGGREIEVGRQVGRFHILTHAYWREAGAEFGNVNIMAVAHGQDKDLLLAHKQAIDKHLQSLGISVSHTAVFWGGRSEIKPSEISPIVYDQWWSKPDESL